MRKPPSPDKGEVRSYCREEILATSSDFESGDTRVQLWLAVPYEKKERAKMLGARWHAERKQWFVPHGVDINKFRDWWPSRLKARVLSEHEKVLKTAIGNRAGSLRRG